MADKINLAKAYVQIVPTTEGIKKNLENVMNNAGTSSGKSFSSGFKNVTGAIGKSLAVGISASLVAIGKTIKDSVTKYADYEQLVGGIETLYKESADKVKQYSEEAYKTSGQSANEYMRMVTSFSASLISSLGGDTAKASEIANQTIIDMSDNVNKLGNSAEMVENAYRGFARQNFTMLDNLALGFAGTKKGMQELLDKAEEISGIKYDISSYADIVNAIHVVQTEMGITGTTAKESAETISGSLNSLKASWSNLITHIADENANFELLADNFVESAKTAFDNIVPRTVTALGGASKVVSELLPVLTDAVPELAKQTVPSVKTATHTLLVSLVDSLMSNSGLMIEGVGDLASDIARDIPELTKPIIEATPDVLESIVDVVSDGDLAASLIDAATDIVLQLVGEFPDLTTIIVEAIPSIFNAVEKAIEKAALNLDDVVEGVFDGIVEIIDNGIETTERRVSEVGEFLDLLDKLYTDSEKTQAQHMKRMNEIADDFGALRPFNLDGAHGGSGGTWEIDYSKKYANEIAKTKKIIDEQVQLFEQANATINKETKKATNELLSGATARAKTYLEKQTEILNNLKALDKITLQEEVAFWKDVVKHTKKGTSDYKEAYRNYYSTKKELNSKIAELDDKLAQNIADVTNNMIDSINELTDAYKTAVDERKSAILSSFSILEELQMNEGKTADELFVNMFNQVEQVKEYAKVLEALRNRENVNPEFFNEIASLGVAETETIRTLSEMSDEMLQAYISMFNERNKIAEKQAINENEQLKADTQAMIKALEKEAKAQVKELKKVYKKELKELGKSLKSNAKEIGDNVVKGIWNGMDDKTEWLADKVSTFSKKIGDTIKDYFGIHSPARLTREYGQHIISGLGLGIADKSKTVIKQASDISKELGAKFNDITASSVEELTSLPISSNFNVSSDIGTSDTLISKLNEIANKLDDLAQKESSILLDGNTLVGKTINRIDRGLGELSNRNMRGVIV